MEIKEINYAGRIINFVGDVTEDKVTEIIEKITKINIDDSMYIDNALALLSSLGFSAPNNQIQIPPITINLSTYGGSVYDGFAICDAIKTSETPITVVCFGKVMSMGIPILLASAHRVAHKNTTFMIHGTAGGALGKVPDIAEEFEEIQRMEEVYSNYILTHSKFPKKKLQNILDKKQNYYFGVDEALQYGIIDEIIE